MSIFEEYGEGEIVLNMRDGGLKVITLNELRDAILEELRGSIPTEATMKSSYHEPHCSCDELNRLRRENEELREELRMRTRYIDKVSEPKKHTTSEPHLNYDDTRGND